MDLNNEMMEKFDGKRVYAQNKRQKVAMAEHYARTYPSIYTATMHPGWADTPGLFLGLQTLILFE